jgi:hypothetical protein
MCVQKQMSTETLQTQSNACLDVSESDDEVVEPIKINRSIHPGDKGFNDDDDYDPVSDEDDHAFLDNDTQIQMSETDVAGIDVSNIISGRRARTKSNRWEHPDETGLLKKWTKNFSDDEQKLLSTGIPPQEGEDMFEGEPESDGNFSDEFSDDDDGSTETGSSDGSLSADDDSTYEDESDSDDGSEYSDSSDDTVINAPLKKRKLE